MLRCINYLETFTQGSIRIHGEEVGPQSQDGKMTRLDEKRLNALRQGLGMVFQGFNLFPHKSVLDNIMMAPIDLQHLSRTEAKTRAMKLLQQVDLQDKAEAMPASLSGGQKQRIAIARALAMEPQVMLFDEPTSALDPEMVGEVLKVMEKLAKTGMTMIVVTHEMNFARHIADKVCFMEHGQIIDSGAPEDIFSRSNDSRVGKFVNKLEQQ